MIRSFLPLLLATIGQGISAGVNTVQAQAAPRGTARATAAVAQGPVQFTDISGRRISLAKPASRVLIDDGRFLMAMALIDPDPVRTPWRGPRISIVSGCAPTNSSGRSFRASIH